MKTLIIAILATIPLSGCYILAPSPAVEAAQIAAAAANGFAAMAPSEAKQPVVHEHTGVQNVCIEFNNRVQIADIVPAIQNELQKHGVDSRVYEPGTVPSGCVILNYVAYVRLDRHVLSDLYDSYMDHAMLSLSQNGKVLATSSYDVGSWDKWGTTQKKLAPVVTSLLPDQKCANWKTGGC
ncbi:hypothetical protein [Paludibacterium yongneupense]|uniref:hypothetical protein n=1 Tax=Paludibacterium yongneupense TaxID=400061 RepID=UPI0003FEB420|nr:hypothetical protein [Paludibacterium yongneupense]